MHIGPVRYLRQAADFSQKLLNPLKSTPNSMKLGGDLLLTNMKVIPRDLHRKIQDRRGIEDLSSQIGVFSIFLQEADFRAREESAQTTWGI